MWLWTWLFLSTHSNVCRIITVDRALFRLAGPVFCSIVLKIISYRLRTRLLRNLPKKKPKTTYILRGDQIGDENHAASGPDDINLRIQDVDKKKLIGQVDTDEAFPESVTMSGNGQFVASKMDEKGSIVFGVYDKYGQLHQEKSRIYQKLWLSRKGAVIYTDEQMATRFKDGRSVDVTVVP